MNAKQVGQIMDFHDRMEVAVRRVLQDLGMLEEGYTLKLRHGLPLINFPDGNEILLSHPYDRDDDMCFDVSDEVLASVVNDDDDVSYELVYERRRTRVWELVIKEVDNASD